jgi:GxxExxY protein
VGQVIDLSVEENQISGKIVDCGLYIHKKLGAGLLENAYEECLVHLLSQRENLKVERQKILPVYLDDLKIDAGYRLDLLVENKIIVEIKSVERILPVHDAQIITYLKLSKLKVGLLINFNVPLFKDGVKRIVL